MEGEYIRALTELTQTLLSKDVNISKFHGYENEDINRWFEKLELILESKDVRLDHPAARTQLINNLAGPCNCLEEFFWLRPGYVQVGIVCELKFCVAANLRVKFFCLKEVRLP